jgi:acetyl esterase/lipase
LFFALRSRLAANAHWQTPGSNLVTSAPALDDAQRTMGLVRLHVKEWHIDPHKIGVIGFSAESARPDFAIAVYPGHLATDNDGLNPNVPVSSETPPTFLLQAEDDNVDGVHQSLVYFAALKKVGVPVEMHLYAHGGHAFGLRRTQFPISDWPRLVETWLRTIGVISE